MTGNTRAGAYGTVGCLDAASGRTIWKVDLVGDHGIERPGFGYACTPLILDTAVLVFGGERGPSLLALDVHTGRPRWQSGHEGSGYSSPLPIRVGSTTQVAAFLQNTVAAFAPASGSELWRYPWSRGYDPHPAWMLYAVAPGFMVGFAAALPFSMPAAVRYTAQKTTPTVVLLTSLGFAAYYLACAAFILWRTRPLI